MSEDIVIRILLLPLALLYGLGIGLRNLLYRIGALRSVRFDLPVISVGNLTVGGAGKSSTHRIPVALAGSVHPCCRAEPRLWTQKHSRLPARYGDGYRWKEVGDEPLQFKRKFPNVPDQRQRKPGSRRA
jgi:tetraacyldisaccharide 4'-kinase